MPLSPVTKHYNSVLVFRSWESDPRAYCKEPGSALIENGSTLPILLFPNTAVRFSTII